METKCDFCGREFRQLYAGIRFCCRTCSDQWHAQERREAIEHFRALGLRPQVPATEREAAE